MYGFEAETLTFAAILTINLLLKIGHSRSIWVKELLGLFLSRLSDPDGSAVASHVSAVESSSAHFMDAGESR